MQVNNECTLCQMHPKSTICSLISLEFSCIKWKLFISYCYAMDATLVHLLQPAFLEFWIGRYYTLIVGANERRWRRVRNQLKVVADSFKMLDIWVGHTTSLLNIQTVISDFLPLNRRKIIEISVCIYILAVNVFSIAWAKHDVQSWKQEIHKWWVYTKHDVQ